MCVLNGGVIWFDADQRECGKCVIAFIIQFRWANLSAKFYFICWRWADKRKFELNDVLLSLAIAIISSSSSYIIDKTSKMTMDGLRRGAMLPRRSIVHDVHQRNTRVSLLFIISRCWFIFFLLLLFHLINLFLSTLDCRWLAALIALTHHFTTTNRVWESESTVNLYRPVCLFFRSVFAGQTCIAAHTSNAYKL